ncbi:RagB/SusD family nutrient uptake outer membrane protein [Dyadobacter sp. LHD-138]|uniref:RagB/SusD family nutrient uptake outer membrane protein n=1 Tax=Dyadobacter sp. LHD-138 TaxID=3071413 RepID=UPI0027DEE830|nr:RagB/SusD family nutrient uptake outer membrane protein [Dyadobacter sp. LHD-138]MDQ6477059.1 RagB/SusD family nutrient uptake outer membrane protein [Dyadobacter sp. LHD-138]
MINIGIIRKYSGKAILVCLLLTQLSCSDFLEVESREQVSDATLWQTTGNADLFLNNVYSGIPGPFNTFDPGENFTDNAMNGVNGQTSRTLYANSVYTPSNAPSAWGRFTNIRACNLFIEKVTASQLPEPWKKVRLAEARFVRAYYYMLLWTNYGGVPIIDNVLNQNEQGDEIFRARNTAEETYQFIVSECAAIANDLPETVQAGRASKGAALTLQGFCELYQASPLYNPTNDKAKWLKAAQTSKKVIDQATYSLFPNYETMLLEANNNNNEIIFAKQYLGGTSLGGGREGLQGPWIVGGIQHAYGGVNPTQELVDEYAMANGLSISDPASGYDPQKPYTNREKRFYQSVIYDGASWLDKEMIMKQGVGSRNATDLSNTNEATNTGYYLKKGLDPKYAVNGDHRLSSANFVIFRYAEVLLNYAEAQNEATGPDASVYEAVNKVRARSELPALKTGLTQEQMRVAIYRERRVELAFEEKRWYDLMRLKLAEKNLNGTLHAMVIEQTSGKWNYKVVPAPDGSRTFFAEKNYVFPVPQSAIDRNSKLTQNPNY